jgi:X-X-X-Leu-X-X-Gly heptad repeat protein
MSIKNSEQIINDILYITNKIKKGNSKNKIPLVSTIVSSPFSEPDVKSTKLTNMVLDFFKKDYNVLKNNNNSNEFGKDLKRKIGEGVGKLGEGVGKLGEGVGKLGEGVGKLGEGVGILKDKTKKSLSDLKKKIVEGIKDKTKAEKNIILDINKIKNITKLVKNNFIYIDITNLIKGYKFSVSENKYFIDDPLLNMILYISLSNNEDNKNRIIYFIRKDSNNKNKIYVYNVNKGIQYKAIEVE